MTEKCTDMFKFLPKLSKWWCSSGERWQGVSRPCSLHRKRPITEYGTMRLADTTSIKWCQELKVSVNRRHWNHDILVTSSNYTDLVTLCGVVWCTPNLSRTLQCLMCSL